MCNGDSSTCVRESGSFNSSSYGYNFVVRIPAGASSIDIRQNGHGGRKKDDNYIAVRDVDTGEYLMNGGFILSMFKKSIQYGDVILDYTGSDTVTERLNSTKPIKKDLVVEVLTVGALNPPDIIFTYLVSREKQVEYRWMTADRWSHCDRLCKGELVLYKPVLGHWVCCAIGTSSLQNWLWVI